MQDLGAPMSYITLEEDAPVYTSDGRELGHVRHVLADLDNDIFDGIVIDASAPRGGNRFVDAPQVADIYERGVVLVLDSQAAEELPEPSENPPELGVHPDETHESDLRRKLRDAWDRISGSY